MQKITGRLTVFFEQPFWVGVYEREQDGVLEACKITFGAEPRDCEVYAFLLENWHRLRFGPAVDGERRGVDCKNPKRLRRKIARQLAAGGGAGTRSQQALQLQREEGKLARKQRSRREREAEQRRRFALRQAKKKEKHRGR